MAKKKGMTEAEWLGCADPAPMWGSLEGRASDRKLRLFACACCRRGGSRFPSGWPVSLTNAVERYADGGMSDGKFVGLVKAEAIHWVEVLGLPAWWPVWSGWSGSRRAHVRDLLWLVSQVAAMLGEEANDHGAARRAPPGEEIRTPRAVWAAAVAVRVNELRAQAALLRDMFGNPFRPVSLVPAWLTPTVLKLAQAAYDNRLLPSGLLDNSGLAILADALVEAGCDNADILSHLRGPGPHARGCWLLDLLLNKE
jgi:hypothetical protein